MFFCVYEVSDLGEDHCYVIARSCGFLGLWTEYYWPSGEWKSNRYAYPERGELGRAITRLLDEEL